MLERPDLADEKIVACVRENYGLSAAGVYFLPLGADLSTAVYRVVTDDEAAYFLKLRRGAFNETSVALTRFLSDLGIPHVLPSLTTRAGQLWTHLVSC